MERLPAADAKSRAIVEKMRDDEARHGAMPRRPPARRELPFPVKGLMRVAADVMRAGRVPRLGAGSRHQLPRRRAAPKPRRATPPIAADRAVAAAPALAGHGTRDRAGVDRLHDVERRAKT